MNKMVREREQQEIAEKNLSIAKKLDSVKPYYNAQEWVSAHYLTHNLLSYWKLGLYQTKEEHPHVIYWAESQNSVYGLFGYFLYLSSDYIPTVHFDIKRSRSWNNIFEGIEARNNN